jgi:U3 small nucleolar ribonucleoprotein component
MTKFCKNLVNAYIEWLCKNISIKEINGMYEITTPFLDNHNDHIQIYIKKSDSRLILTDNGQTITNLRLSGFEFTP